MVDEARGGQDGALGLAVEERIDRLKSRIGAITTKLIKVNVERNISYIKNQKQTTKKRFKHIRLNTHERTDQTEEFTKYFSVKFEDKNKRTMNPVALRNEIVRLAEIIPKRIHSSKEPSFTIEAGNRS